MAHTPAEIAYRRRLRVAAVLSLMLHAAFVCLIALNPGACAPESSGFINEQKPVVVHLQPRDPEPRVHLVDPATPSTLPPDETDRIAETDAQAQDTSDAEGDPTTPDLTEIGDADRLGGQPAPMPAPELVPSAPALPDKARDEAEPVERDAEVEPAPERMTVDVAPKTADQEAAEPAETVPADADNPAPPVPPQPFHVAQAESIPVPAPDDGRTRARKPGGVDAQGFANFEAKQHELAPYLKSVREKVEREWRAALQMRYTGTTPTKAVIRCDINPKGEIVNVEIVEPGTSVSYGPLCKDAIERAGPFGPFPFEVPPIYQNQNLEIRWTFSFM